MKPQRPGDQPPPTPNEGEAVWPKVIEAVKLAQERSTLMGDDELAARYAPVIADMEARDRLGRERYGTPLQPFNGRDALRDLYEELLDASAYAMQVSMEAPAREAQRQARDLGAALVGASVAVRRAMDERAAADGGG
jgi:hypothetical protein